jgi:hypothetical protein
VFLVPLLCISLLAAPLGAFASAPPQVEPPKAKRPPGSALVMPDKDKRPSQRPADLSSLRRLVKEFDFEDAERFPAEMPVDWKRLLTVTSGRPGYPDFGRIELSDSQAREGKWSLQYTLVGGSMSTRLPPGIVRIFPGSRYRISCWVRTEGLQRAAVRMVARLHDREGNPTGNDLATEPIRSEGEWTQIRIDLPEVTQRASDMSLELELVQSSALADESQSAVAEPRDRTDDIRGFAWFDDLEVWQIPSIRFGNQNAAQVFGADGTRELEIELRDLVSDELVADIVVTDIDGNVVHSSRLPLPGAGALVKVPLPIVEPGSYAASLTVSADGIVLAKRTVDLAILDQDRAKPSHGTTPRFGVSLPPTSDADLPAMRAIVSEIDPDLAIVPAWTPDFEPLRTDSRIAAMRDFLDAMLDRRIEPVLAITSVPASLAAPHHLDRWQALEYFGDDDASSALQLEPWLLAFGQHVERWQLGDPGSESRGEPLDRDAAMRVRAMLDQRVAGPVLLIPAEADIDDAPAPPGVVRHVRVPWSARPDTVGEYVQPWRDDEAIITFEIAPHSMPDRMRVEDLAMRALYAWRSGVRTMAIDLAWKPANTAESRSPTLRSEAIAWRELGRSLSGRTFAGELPMPPGVHAWLAEGAHPALIMWRDDSSGWGEPLPILLSNSAVTAIDPFGKRMVLSPVDGTHHVPLTATPLVIEGIDFPLMRLIATARLEPESLESRRSPQDARIVLKNTFGVAISGTIAISDQQAWDISPRGQPFSIPAGAEGRIPIRIGLPRSATVGVTELAVDIEMTAGETYVTTLPLRLNVEWSDVEVRSAWRFARSVDTGRIDLVVTVSVTNRSGNTLDLEAFALARDYTQTRRPILKLGPGETALRVFQFPEGARRLSGGQVFAGVSEMDGERRHTSKLLIPPLLPVVHRGTASAESAR